MTVEAPSRHRGLLCLLYFKCIYSKPRKRQGGKIHGADFLPLRSSSCSSSILSLFSCSLPYYNAGFSAHRPSPHIQPTLLPTHEHWQFQLGECPTSRLTSQPPMAKSSPCRPVYSSTMNSSSPRRTRRSQASTQRAFSTVLLYVQCHEPTTDHRNLFFQRRIRNLLSLRRRGLRR